ncbi:GGDEF domain-containing protein [Streptomyces sp. VN1]|uniref:GGDEF domain-containing protein n=1 Tax=Streptomyces sp. VN1 TaxID=1821625 RepID=UPI001413D31F|nr:GGDEF domain-containing protein [Streptomyces sp. VN1]QIP74651.1 GGDEF domain-containing protein [Streptomyces sp. VN1]
MPSAIETGALLDRARTDLSRPDASPHELRSTLAQVLPAVEVLLAEVSTLNGQLAQARTCPVTGLPTRAAWTARACEIVAAGPAAALLVDLDAFKPVNDRFGHAAGDAVLAAVGSRLAEWAATEGAEAGRLGGDEFAVIFPNTSDLPARVARLHAALTRPVHHEGLRLEVGASIGTARTADTDPGAFAGASSALLSALLKNADTAMYRAKGRGRRGRRLAGIVPLRAPALLARVLPFRKAA